MRYLYVLLFAAAFLPLQVRADLLLENEHSVTSCIVVENLGDFPEYALYFSGESRFPFAIPVTEEGVCIDGLVTLIGVAQGDVTALTLTYIEGDTEQAGAWPDLPENADLIVRSEWELGIPRSLPNTSPVVAQRYVVHIESVEETGIAAETVRIEQEDKRGNVTVVDEATAALAYADERTNTALPPWAIALIAMGTLGLGLALTRWKK